VASKMLYEFRVLRLSKRCFPGFYPKIKIILLKIKRRITIVNASEEFIITPFLKSEKN